MHQDNLVGIDTCTLRKGLVTKLVARLRLRSGGPYGHESSTPSEVTEVLYMVELVYTACIRKITWQAATEITVSAQW